MLQFSSQGIHQQPSTCADGCQLPLQHPRNPTSNRPGDITQAMPASVCEAAGLGRGCEASRTGQGRTGDRRLRR